MEFKLTKPIEELRAEAIAFNLPELKTKLTNALAKFSGKSYDDKTIAEAKGDRASLNRLKSQIEEVRKSAKKEWNEPFLRFENDVKSLIELVDKPLSAIDEQVKGYEERRKAEKRRSLEEHFNSIIGENALLLAFEHIFNERWLNVTFSMEKAKTEIQEEVHGFMKDLEVLSKEESEFKDQLYDFFLRTRSLSLTLSEKHRLISQKTALEQLKERERIASATKEQTPVKTQITDKKTQLIKIQFEAEAEKDDLLALSQYMKHNNIKFRRI